MAGLVTAETSLGPWELVSGSNEERARGSSILQVNEGQCIEIVDVPGMIAKFAQDFIEDGSFNRETLFAQIKRDMAGTSVMIDGQAFSGKEGEDAQVIYELLRSSMHFKTNEEILRFMSLLQQGLFADGWGDIMQGLQCLTGRTMDPTSLSSKDGAITDYCSQNGQRNYEIILDTGTLSIKGVMYYVLFSIILPKKVPEAIIRSSIVVDPVNNHAQRAWQIVKVFS